MEAMEEKKSLFRKGALMSLLIGVVTGPLFAQEVGIGTTIPAARLDIQAPATYTADLLRVLHGSNTYLVVDNNGHVGIGKTPSSSYKLDIAGDYIRLDGTNDADLHLNVPNTATYSPEISFRIDNTKKAHIRADHVNQRLSIYEQFSAPYTLLTLKGGNIGIGTPNPAYRLHITGDGMIYAEGTLNTGDTLPTGARTAFIWTPRKAAIRAGRVMGNQWNNTNVGNYSVAFGVNNMASAVMSTVSGGGYNTASFQGSTVGGGEYNSTSYFYATVSGGYGNAASSIGSSVGGGSYDTASGEHAAVSGGYRNVASGYYSSITGGHHNRAQGYLSTIGGGYGNKASGYASTVSGGDFNLASGQRSVVIGGHKDTASGQFSTVLGGHNNTAAGDYSWAAGRGMKLGPTADRTFVWGYDPSTTPPTITTSDAFLIGPSGNIIKVGIGTPNPTSDLDVNGVIRLRALLSAPPSPNAGDIYFDGTHFYGYDGTNWKQLDN